MAFDFTPQIDELCAFLSSDYGIADRQAIEYLLSTAIKIPRVPPPRVFIETDWTQEDCSTAWFAFGGVVNAHSLGTLRAMRPYSAARRLSAWCEDDHARGLPTVIVDSAWRAPLCVAITNHQRVRDWGQEKINREAVHVRVHLPRNLANVISDVQAIDARRGKLKALAHGIANSEVRDKITPRAILPRDYGFWCELALKCSRPGTDWTWLSNEICQCAIRRAALYNRPQTDESDWRLAARLLRDQIPSWVISVLQPLAAGDIPRLQPDRWKGPDRARWIGPIAAALPRWRVEKVVYRLTDAGVLKRHRPRLGYKITQEIEDHMAKMVAGTCFG